MATVKSIMFDNYPPIQVLRRPLRILPVYDPPVLAQYIRREDLLSWQLPRPQLDWLEEVEFNACVTHTAVDRQGTAVNKSQDEIYRMFQKFLIDERMSRDNTLTGGKVYRMYIRILRSLGNITEKEAYRVQTYGSYINSHLDVNTIKNKKYRICKTHQTGQMITITATKTGCYLGDVTVVIPQFKSTSTYDCCLGYESKVMPQSNSSPKPGCDIEPITAHITAAECLVGYDSCVSIQPNPIIVYHPDVQFATDKMTTVDCLSGDIKSSIQRPKTAHGQYCDTQSDTTIATECIIENECRTIPPAKTLDQYDLGIPAKTIPQSIPTDENVNDIQTANTSTTSSAADCLVADKQKVIPLAIPTEECEQQIQAKTNLQAITANEHGHDIQTGTTSTRESDCLSDEDEDDGIMCGILGVYTRGQMNLDFSLG